MVATDPPTIWDFLSQAARRQPPPRRDPEFLESWAGLSVFDTYRTVHQNARKFRWRHGEYIVILSIPNDAPFTYKGPGHRGHWMLYDIAGNMLTEEGADFLRRHCVESVVHGPSTEDTAF